jgi:cell surface protein
MKTLTILFVAAIMMGVGCSKSEDSENNPDKPDKPSPLPDLPDPNDVCSCMDDIIFMQYCYDNFDVNKDGKVSKIEASAVAKIDLARQEIKTLTGIGYFSNLEILNCKECHELTTVDLSNNLKVRIGDEMFYTCSKLSKIVLPNNILEIGESAFYGCSSLKNIDIPDKVTEIGDSAFRRCSSLMSINIPKEVTEIGRQAFGSCVSLTSINIPKRVTRLEDLFSNCSSLRSVTFEKGSQLKYIFGGLYSSYDGMFCNCEALTSIEIPASVEMIKGCIFNNCSSLRSVTFEKGSQLKYMVEGVFCDCEALTSIEIPASVEMIDMYYCINLANIYCYPSIPPILNDFRCKNFVLYVPSQSLEAYKNSSWSEYYSSIKTIQ